MRDDAKFDIRNSVVRTLFFEKRSPCRTKWKERMDS